MAVPPLLNLPNSSCMASIVMGLTRVVGISASPFTLEEQSYKWQGEIWTIDFVMPPMKPNIAREWQAFGLKLKGQYGRFLIGDPLGKEPKGVATGTPLVKGINQTGNTLVTDGWSPNVQGILLAGDYIQLGSGASSKLHMVTEDANSDSSGNANLSIEPALRASPADNSSVIINNPMGVFRLTSNSWSWQASPGPIYRMSFQAQEVISA